MRGVVFTGVRALRAPGGFRGSSSTLGARRASKFFIEARARAAQAAPLCMVSERSRCLFALDTVNRTRCSRRPHRRSPHRSSRGGRVLAQHPKSNGKTSVCHVQRPTSNK
jgi:hypothetical protein